MKTLNINGKDFTIEELTSLIEEAKKTKHWIEIQEKNHWHTAPSIKEIHSFKTFMQSKIHLMLEMTIYADLHNDGWEADWENSKQKKWGIFYTNFFLVGNSNMVKDFFFGIAVKSKEIAQSMLEEFKDRLHVYNESI